MSGWGLWEWAGSEPIYGMGWVGSGWWVGQAGVQGPPLDEVGAVGVAWWWAEPRLGHAPSTTKEKSGRGFVVGGDIGNGGRVLGDGRGFQRGGRSYSTMGLGWAGLKLGGRGFYLWAGLLHDWFWVGGAIAFVGMVVDSGRGYSEVGGAWAGGRGWSW